MFSLRAVSDTFLLQSSYTLCICSHRTLSADIGFSGGGGLFSSGVINAFMMSSAFAGFAR